MKTTIFRRKTPAFFGAAAILLAAVFTIGCKTEISSDPAPETFTVEMKAGEHGTLSANPVIPASGKVAKDTVITFTAAPASGYKVDKWTITGGAFETGTGTEGSLTAKVKISANTKVNVSFKAIAYNTVSFADLNTYLKDTASSADINYIKVTRLTAADLKGDEASWKPSPLGKILNDDPTKKVALKLSEVSGLTDMSCCFYHCTSLIQAPVIPSSVTNMNSCFSYCTSLTQAPMIPSNVTNMQGCFSDCTSLTQAPVIPSTVTNMQGCFYHCTSLTQAPVIPSSVTDMKSCFYNCENLTQAPVIPSSVTNMEDCFSGCKSLTQAPVIPSSVTNMDSCFSDCTSLTQAPVIPSSVTNMRYCFSYCKNLTQAPKIPSGVTNMEDCFFGCKSLTQAPVIPSGVTDMTSCFGGCTSLTQAPVIPSGVTNMRWCFSGCKNITAVTLKCNYNAAEIYGAPTFKDAFKDCEKLTAGSIKVPAGQVAAYQAGASTMGTTADRFVAE